MAVTGPARDGTRLGLIDVGVPRYISIGRLVRTRASVLLRAKADESPVILYQPGKWLVRN